MYQVVVVDDEWWILQGILKTFNFKQMGFNVSMSSTDPKEVLRYLKNNKVDAVFTDIKMPEYSGIDLIKESRKIDCRCEFVIISGYAEFSYAQEAIREGAFDYCLKPIKQEKADSILNSLNNKLNKRNNKTSKKENIEFKKIDNPEFKKMLRYINKNFEETLYLKNLSQKFGFNSNYVCHLFNKYLDKSFSEYLTDLRMQKAEELLKKEKLSIKEIAARSGYNDYYYFNKVFKKCHDLTASEFRKKLK